MKYKLKIIDRQGADFEEIKRSGFGGVVFTESLINIENLKSAKKRSLKTFFHIRDFERIKCFFLNSGGLYKDCLYAVTQKSVKGAAEKSDGLLDMLDGFVFPAPSTKGLLWNDGFSMLYEDFCGRDIKDDFPLIFDKDAENADFRIWYYNAATQVMFLDYILPLAEYVRALGKKACFDFGSAGSGIELIKKQLNPFFFQKYKIPVVYETEDGINLVCGRQEAKTNLLVLPMRSIMLNYAYGEKYSRKETPLILALSEEEYYKNTLKKCGIDYRVVDEKTFSGLNTNQLKGFANILICDSCIFSKEDKDRIEQLKRKGYKINEKAFLDILDRVN